MLSVHSTTELYPPELLHGESKVGRKIYPMRLQKFQCLACKGNLTFVCISGPVLDIENTKKESHISLQCPHPFLFPLFFHSGSMAIADLCSSLIMSSYVSLIVLSLSVPYNLPRNFTEVSCRNTLKTVSALQICVRMSHS